MASVNISVRELIAFVMRGGSLDRPYVSYARLRQGTALHKAVQSRAPEGYMPEVPLSADITLGDVTFHLTGRADGIIDDDSTAIVDEIKSTARSLTSVSPSDYPEYVAQAECYAYMYAAMHGYDRVTVRLTFVSTDTLECEHYDSVRSFDELRGRVVGLLSEYMRFAKIAADGTQAFKSSAKKLKFPHHDYRLGQQDIILDTFGAIRRSQRLMVQAPTGIGKTLSVCYGAVKAIGEGAGRRIFYLTPKSTVGQAPTAAFDIMREHGLKARVITLFAKEKCCVGSMGPKDCTSVTCANANGHYDRINDALYTLLTKYGDIDKAAVETVARTFCVCPYELMLDAATYCDVIICDCNYLFDPRVFLRRFFDDDCDPSESIALVDEAHDLVDRAREMYSAQLSLSDFEGFAPLIPDTDFILYSPLKNIIGELCTLRRKCTENRTFLGEDEYGTRLSNEPFSDVADACREFFTAAIGWLRVNGDNAAEVPYGTHTLAHAVREAAFAAKRYADASKRADGSFRHLAERRGERVSARVICIDPSKLLDKCMTRVRSTVLFSATLAPMEYFSDLLGAKRATKLKLSSPFERDQLFTAIMNKISLRYADRERTLAAVVEIIDAVVNARYGNYLIFLPSYEMLSKVAHAYSRFDPSADIRVQKPDMSEAERAKFLANFKEDSAVIGFAVLGGMFAESIDLAGEKLIGTVVVGTGLARLNLETNIVADYFEQTREAGFEYAYLYPAMNKVLQAVGRVIRSENDRGVCVLIDDRYATPQYSRLLTDHLKDIRLAATPEALMGALEEFWDDGE